MIRIGSLFSGIGGLELGIEAALSERGIAHHVAWQVEREPFPRSILAKHWPSADRTVEDVTLASESNLAPVDLICGGFPCQDLSYAGKGAGLEGERSGLWSEYRRIVCELRPRIVIVENVAALLTRGVERVLGDLAALGYDARWRCVRASDVGAPHRRERLFIVGWRRGSGTVADPLSGSAGVDAERAPMADGTAGVRRQPGAKRVPLCASRDGTGRSMADSIGHGWGVGLTDADGGRMEGGERAPRRDGPAQAIPVAGGSSVEREREAGVEDAVANACSAGQRAESSARCDRSKGSGRDSLRARAKGRDQAMADAGCADGQARCANRLRDDAPTGDQSATATCSCARDMANTDGQRWQTDGRPGERASVFDACHEDHGACEGRSGGPLRRMGRDPHGLPPGLDRHPAGLEAVQGSEAHALPAHWPAGPGQAQHAWEPPRTTRQEKDRAARLKALGNAVVPAVGREVMRWAMTWIDAGGEP